MRASSFAPATCPIASLPSGQLTLCAGLQPLPGELAQGVSNLVLAGVGTMHVDHRGAGTAVPHAVHQLAQGRSGARCENIPGMPQVVKVRTSQSGF